MQNAWGAFFVGLTAHDMSDMGRLAQLAMNPSGGASREEIYLAVASLYRIQGTGLNERERGLMRDILRRLTRDVEMAIRIAVAQRLAEDVTAPYDLILMLVDDAIEVARPLILKSPLLREEDVLALIAHGVAHQEAVAARPNIGERVTDALVACEAESVLLTLVRNATAKISRAGYAKLVERSRTVAALQEPLARRPDLPRQLSEKMCEWVSEALKSYIKANYDLAPARVDQAVAAARESVHREPPGPSEQPENSAHKLIDKLAASGQLKASFLMRVLGQGQIDLFDLAFARLTGIELDRFRALFYDNGARTVALACRAIGIDRSVFATVYNLSRQAHGRLCALTKAEMAEADTIFAGFTRQSALQGLRARAHH
jgi:uncharacterized protein (DUF2336 family)